MPSAVEAHDDVLGQRPGALWRLEVARGRLRRLRARLEPVERRAAAGQQRAVGRVDRDRDDVGAGAGGGRGRGVSAAPSPPPQADDGEQEQRQGKRIAA